MTLVAKLPWNEIESRLTAGGDAILPIGAGAKEHGLHLPMNTDEIQAMWLSERVAAETGALVWPAVNYGFYPAFRDYPGSISLSRPLFVAMIRELCSEIMRWRPRRLYVLDTGISTIAPVGEAILGLERVVHLRVHDGPRYREASAALRQQSFGSHADELETSRMLAIAPQSVDMARAQASPGGPFEGRLTRALAPSGSYGDPTLANAEKGARLIDAMLADLREAMRPPGSPIADGTG
jgi:creatinine amidohydrolase